MVVNPWSLRWVIGGIYLVIMVVLLGALALSFSHQAEEYTMARMRQTVRGQAILGSKMLAPLLAELNSTRPAIQRRALHDARTTVMSIQYSARAQRVIFRTHDDAVHIEYPPPPGHIPSLFNPWQPEIRAANTNSIGEDLRYMPEADTQALFVAIRVKEGLPLSLSAGGDERTPDLPGKAKRTAGSSNAWGYLIIAVPTTEVLTEINRIRGTVGLAFLSMMVILLFINLGISNYVTKPLATLSTAAGRFAAGNLSERVYPIGATEVASLGTSFNRMAEQLRITINHLAEQRAQAEAILTSMVDGIVVTDLTGRIVLVNHSAEQICDIQASSVIGRTLTEAIFHFELHELLAKTIATSLPMRHEITFALPTERMVEVHLAPVEVDGQPKGVVIVLYDITHQRKLEQVRRDFVANVSHELRTPVSSIRAMAETLIDTETLEPEMSGEFLNTIVRESDRLTSLVDDLLHLARIESDRRPLTLAEIDLNAVIEHVTQRVMAPITAKEQLLVVEMPTALRVTADQDALVQILVNLLDNARKYSPEGGRITIQVSCDTMLRITVRDTGYGIPAEDLERVFERFYRVDRARTRAQGGTGLGLAIVKHLVELHGGRIQVTSELGEGSAFTVLLPQPTDSTITPEEAGELSPGHQMSVSP